MSKKRNACSGAASPEQAAGRKRQKSSHNDHSTLQVSFPVYDILPTGAENSVSPQQLANRLGLRSTRLLRKEIERERKDGALILADLENGGYFRPDNTEEIRHFVGAMQHSVQTTLSCIAPMEKTISEEEKDEL